MSNLGGSTTNSVRLAILYFGLFFAGAVLAHTDDLKGCWLRIKTANRLSGNVELSDLRTVASKCHRRFDGVVITNTCAGSNRRELEQYRVASNGTLETRLLPLLEKKWLDPATHSKLKEVEQLVEFRPRRFELRENELTIFHPSLVQPNVIASIEVLRRVGPATDEACEPPQILVSKEKFSRYFMIPQLVAAHADRTLRPFFAMAFSKEKLGSIPEKAVRQEHVRRLLEEFDKATTELSVLIRKRLESDPQSLIDAFFANYPYDPASDPDLAGIEKQQWAKETAGELLELGKLSAYLAIVGSIYGDALQKASSGLNRVDQVYGVGDTYILERELLQTGVYEHLPEGTLPVDRRSLVALRELSRKNAELAKSRRYSPPLKLGDALGKAARQLLEKDKAELAGAEHAIFERLDLLAKRFRSTLDPWEMGNCEFDGLDKESVAISESDWRIAKKANGEPIVQGSIEHMHLLDFFLQGCGPKKDFGKIRNSMDDFVAGHAQPGEPTRVTNRRKTQLCVLARWARYGIGGERSEARAME